MIILLLNRLAAHGRWVLVFGLAVGVAIPDLAFAMRPWLGELVTALLFLAALRVDPRRIVGALADLRRSLGYALLLQMVLPVVAIAGLQVSGWSGALPAGLVLMLAAAPISGSPNLTILTGGDPAPALRQLVVGTFLLPLTIVPVLWLTPAFGEPTAVFISAARLLGTIAVATGLAFAVRATILKHPSGETLGAIDGISAFAMAVLVVGLMSAVGPALRFEPRALATALVVAFGANFGTQVAAGLWLRRLGVTTSAAALAIVAGNRNIALFLTALPTGVTDPLLLFIGCYQIPMYLTPMVLGRFHRTGRIL